MQGNHTQSALLAGLQKFMLCKLRVLTFVRIGNGVPSSPLILEWTEDDSMVAVCLNSPNNRDSRHFFF